MVCISWAGPAVAASVVLLSAASSFATNSMTKFTHGRTAAINSPSEWCMFLPPKPADSVSAHEYDAVAFCSTPRAPKNAPGARVFPKGFITATHYQKFKKYVQVTGRINPAKYKMSRGDTGGQFDMKAPIGAMCAGYKRFVNLVEPDVGLFCIRCCVENDKKLCNTYKSTYGCKGVIKGNYGPQSNRETVSMLEFMPANFTAPATVVVTATITATPSPTGKSTGDSDSRHCQHSSSEPTPTSSLPLPTASLDMEYPEVKSPTFRFVMKKAKDPIVKSVDEGCVDLIPSGNIDWSVPNGTISYATVFIPASVSASVMFFVEKKCRGIAVYDLEKDTISTGRPTAVDILPQFYGNFVGPQSARVQVVDA